MDILKFGRIVLVLRGILRILDALNICNTIAVIVLNFSRVTYNFSNLIV